MYTHYTATYIYPIQIRVWYLISLCSGLTLWLKEKEKLFSHFTMKNLWEENNFSFRRIYLKLYWIFLFFSTIKKYISWITKTIHNHILISLIHNCLSFQSIANYYTNITWKESLSGDSYRIGKTHLNIRIEMEYIRTIDVQKLQVLSCTKYKTNNVKKYKIFVQINWENWDV